jgi:hypothetical protein
VNVALSLHLPSLAAFTRPHHSLPERIHAFLAIPWNEITFFSKV